jgi:hypothetical protein
MPVWRRYKPENKINKITSVKQDTRMYCIGIWSSGSEQMKMIFRMEHKMLLLLLIMSLYHYETLFSIQGYSFG